MRKMPIGRATIAFFFDAGTGRDGQRRLTRAPGQAVASDADRDGFANESPSVCGGTLQHPELCGGALIVGCGDEKHLLATHRQEGGDFRRQGGRNGHSRTGSECEEHDKETKHAWKKKGNAAELWSSAALRMRFAHHAEQ
jgi:hypothetical protein